MGYERKVVLIEIDWQQESGYMHLVMAFGASVLSLLIHFHRVSNDSSETTRILFLIANPSERVKDEDKFNQPYIEYAWNSRYYSESISEPVKINRFGLT